jgi:type IV pilus assembly protein PilB
MAAPPIPLGKLLKEQGLITEDQIKFSLVEQKITGEKIGECLRRLGLISDSDLAKAIAVQSKFSFINLSGFLPEMPILRRFPSPIARQFNILPISIEQNHLVAAISDPFNPVLKEAVFRATGLIADFFVSSEIEIKKIIERFYYLLEHPIEQEIDRVIMTLKRDPAADIDISTLIDNILSIAVSYRATDVHVTPSDITTRIMFRIDGMMSLSYVLPVAMHQKFITNLKIKSEMDISEQRKPQDGRTSFEFLGDTFDIRVSTVRTNNGENMVLRLLPSRGSSILGVNDLGFEENQLKKISNLFAKPYGIVLVTGPTGSGKTTTLYAALKEQDSIGKNILTVEDPIEYEFSMIRQTQVNEKAGYNFASAIRTFLRQDPDVILVGEIRDEETAVLAVRAALTGHLVLSTLHTNTSIGAVARLKDLGISPFLLSSSIMGVIAQRLIRLLCDKCKLPYEPTEEEINKYSFQSSDTLFSPKGCSSCRETGYRGRIVISEVMMFTPHILSLLAEDAPLTKIEQEAKLEGFIKMDEDAIVKLKKGKTSIAEIERVLG